MAFDIEALMSSCAPASPFPREVEKSAFNASLTPFETMQPLTGTTQPPSHFLNRSKRIVLVLFGPNMTGGYSHIYPTVREPVVSGALYHTNNGTQLSTSQLTGRTDEPTGIQFNASRSSAVYKSDVSTVQPASLRALILVRAF